MLKGIVMNFWLFDQRENFEIYFKICTYQKKKNTLCALISICRVGYLHIALISRKNVNVKKILCYIM